MCIKHSRHISSTNTIIVKIQQTRIVSTQTKNGEFFMCTIPLSYVLDSQENREFVLKNIDIWHNGAIYTQLTLLLYYIPK